MLYISDSHSTHPKVVKAPLTTCVCKIWFNSAGVQPVPGSALVSALSGNPVWILVYTSIYWYILIYTLIYYCVWILVYTSIHWYILVYPLIYYCLYCYFVYDRGVPQYIVWDWLGTSTRENAISYVEPEPMYQVVSFPVANAVFCDMPWYTINIMS